MIEFLSDNNPVFSEWLFKQAYNVKVKCLGKYVYLRGLIEFSNICIKDCYYCGIRKSNENFIKYLMSEEEIIKSAIWAFEKGYGSVVLQSGERKDKFFIGMVESLLTKINFLTSGKLRVTISCGEQSKETYRRWFEAGANRYLLRIETSNHKIYESLHPNNYDFNKRLKCLFDLRDIGYQVGTGVMIGLPNQEFKDLANDIMFFRSIEADMIGMGPFIPHLDTPLKSFSSPLVKSKKGLYILSLKMISIARILMPKINIAATTAFQALYPFGREKALLCGANVFMPNISEAKYRKDYRLYDDKPCIDENANECLECVDSRIRGIGESTSYKDWGDSLVYKERIRNKGMDDGNPFSII